MSSGLTNPEWNKMAGSPYASLGTYYHLQPAPKQGKKSSVDFAVPQFGSVGYNVQKVDASAAAKKANSCHVWRAGDFDGRALSKNAYPQCGPGSSCAQYVSRY
jgi:hypothetical protein